MPSSLSLLNSQLRAAGIAQLPEFSRSISEGLTQETDDLHSSAAIEAPIDDFAGWVAVLMDRDGDAAVCGFYGNGVQSRFFILYWRQGPVVFALRVAFGAFEPDGSAAQSASGGIGLAQALIEQASDLQRSGNWPRSRAIIAVSDDIGESGWCWLDTEQPVEGLELDASLGIAGAFAALDALDPDSGIGDEA